MRRLEGKDYYSIGEFAGIIGKTVQTIRNWDKGMLLSPDYKTESGMRYYSEETVAKCCKAYGIQFGKSPKCIIEEIKGVTEELHSYKEYMGDKGEEYEEGLSQIESKLCELQDKV